MLISLLAEKIPKTVSDPVQCTDAASGDLARVITYDVAVDILQRIENEQEATR